MQITNSFLNIFSRYSFATNHISSFMKSFLPAYKLLKKPRPELYLLSVLIVISPALSAQSTIKGSVTDQQSKPVSQANVLLLQSKDSAMVKGMVVAEKGTFSFEKIPNGEYRLLVSFTGFDDYYSSPFSTNGNAIDIGTIQLINTAIQLGTVTVISKKPLFEQKIDRMVINVKKFQDNGTLRFNIEDILASRRFTSTADRPQ